MGRYRRRGGTADFGRNNGAAGVVYILENDGLRVGWVKIGCSTRSGHARAKDLNADANTGTPGSFRCIYQVRTRDCGRAESRVFRELAHHRRGKRGQEFFEVDLAHAQEVITRVCAEVDSMTVVPPPPTAAPPSPPTPSPAYQSRGGRTGISGGAGSGPPFTSGSFAKSPIRLRWLLVGLVVLTVYVANSGKRSHSSPVPTTGTQPAARIPTSTVRQETPPQRSPGPTPAAARSAEPPLAMKEEGSVRVAQADAVALSGVPVKSARLAPEAVGEGSGGEADGRVLVGTSGIPASVPAAVHLLKADLRPDERASLESACSSAKFTMGAAAYLECVQRQLDLLQGAPRAHDLSGLTPAERSSMNSACSSAKFTMGPAALNRCIAEQLGMLQQAPRNIDVSGLSHEELASLNSACSSARFTQGPAAYNNCRQRLLDQLANVPAAPDLSSLTYSERSSMGFACSTAKFNGGPAALRACIAKQFELLRSAPPPTDLRQFSADIRQSIESACLTAKFNRGPADYNRCVKQQVAALQAYTQSAK